MKTIANTIALIVTIAIDIFLVQGLYWMFAYSFVTAPVINLVSALALCAVIATTAIMVFRYFTNKPFFRLAPIISGGLSVVLAIAAMISESVRPDSEHYYTQDSLEFNEERWHDDDGYIIKVKRQKRARGTYKWEIDTEYTRTPNKIEGY